MLISNYSIQHRTTVFVLVVIIVAMGTMAYMSLPRESNPDVEVPYILVSSFYEGVSPSDMESLVTRPLERKIDIITEIKEMKSTSSEGSSVISIEFDPEIDIDRALQKVRDKVDEATPDLPDDLDDPVVKEMSFADQFPVLFVNISGDAGLPRLKEIAEDLEEDIEDVSGVLDAVVLGSLEREIRVEFDPDRLASYGLAMGEILEAIAGNNQNTPGGSIDIGDAKYSLKVPGEYGSPGEINSLVIAMRSGKPIYVTDIAVVRDTFKDRESYSRLDGAPSVAIRVTKRSGENLLRIAEEIKSIVGGYEEKLPPEIRFTVTSDGSKDVKMMVSDLENNILSALILVLAVIFVGLGFRNAILVALAIPFSMLLSFFVIELLGMTLNMVVLFSLVLALGMLVDNAIVIVENIYRHYDRLDKDPVRAAMDGTAEVAWPVIASTATTVAAFGPLVFWPGIMGQFMGYLPKTVIIVLVSSLFVAMVITPTFSAMALIFFRSRKRKKAKSRKGLGPVIRLYRALLVFGLDYRVLTLAFFFGLLGLTIFAFGASGLGTEFFPDTEPKRIMVDIEAPEGTKVERSDEFARQAEAILEKYGNIDHVTTAVGLGSGRESGTNSVRIVVDMVDRELRLDSGDDGKIYFRNSNETMGAIRKDLVEAIVGAEVKVDKAGEGPPGGKPVNVEISGDDYPMLARKAAELKEKIRGVPGIVDLEDDYKAGLPEVNIVVDKERAALFGLNAFLIGQMIKASVNGIKVADYREGEDEYDITARLPEHHRQRLEDVTRMRIPALDGRQVPLSSVAEVVATSGLAGIKHIDRKRVVTVSSNVADGFNSVQVLEEVREIAEKISLPTGYMFRYTGENEEMEESEDFMKKAFLIAVLLIAMILVTQFDSVVTPFIILTSVILSFIGVFLSLIVMRQPFGVIMTGMGVISLAGVVVNNAIVLIDYINLLRKRGMSCREAVIEAGCTRFRPVMLTAATTVLGLMPMAVGISFDFRKFAWIVDSESSQWWGSMATAVIFGLVVATALTLFVAPNLYSLMFDWKNEGTAGSDGGDGVI